MASVKATDIKNKFGEYLEEAIHEPVVINKNGRDVAVLLSQREYDRLLAIEDAHWGEKALQAEASGYLGPEETVAFLNTGK